MAYKAVIFDLDGTLVHTAPEYRYKIVGQTLQEFGKSASNEHADKFWFEHERDYIIIKFFGVQPEQFWEVFRKYEKKDEELRRKSIRVFEDSGIIDLLKQSGFKLGIVTGASVHQMSASIELLGASNFSAIIRAQLSSGIRPKPDPHGIEECLRRMGLKKEDAIFVGNGPEDVQSAKTAGVFDVMIDRGEYTFIDVKPSMSVKSLYDLKKFLGI